MKKTENLVDTTISKQENPAPVKHLVVFHITDTFADALAEVGCLENVLSVEVNAQQNGKFLYRATCMTDI